VCEEFNECALVVVDDFPLPADFFLDLIIWAFHIIGTFFILASFEFRFEHIRSMGLFYLHKFIFQAFKLGVLCFWNQISSFSDYDSFQMLSSYVDRKNTFY
jgi:hypothetical protein